MLCDLFIHICPATVQVAAAPANQSIWASLLLTDSSSNKAGPAVRTEFAHLIGQHHSHNWYMSQSAVGFQCLYSFQIKRPFTCWIPFSLPVYSNQRRDFVQTYQNQKCKKVENSSLFFYEKGHIRYKRNCEEIHMQADRLVKFIFN